METIYDLQRRAEKLATATNEGSISPAEVGGLHRGTLSYIARLEQRNGSLGIRKVYDSELSMNQDTNPLDTHQKPLHYGQLVAVYTDGVNPTVDGNIYAYQAPGWLKIGNVNGFDYGFSVREVDLADLDLLCKIEDVVTENQSVSAFYMITSNIGKRKVVVGTLELFSDTMKHVVTQIVHTHCILNAQGFFDRSHNHNYIYTYTRSYGLTMGSTLDPYDPNYFPINGWGRWRTVISNAAQENVQDLSNLLQQTIYKVNQQQEKINELIKLLTIC